VLLRVVLGGWPGAAQQMVKEKKAKDKKSKKKKGNKKKPKAQPKPFDCAGFTNTDPPRVFRSLAEFWAAFPADSWYPSGASYWDKVTCDDSGMLGGLMELKEPDERSSLALVQALQGSGTGRKRACDVGGGIGRVTQNVLLKCFETVELVEQCPAFLERAARDLPTVGRVCCGLERFDPPPGTFDVFWVQWVTGHLRDEDFVPFVERAVRGLALGGALVIKDNTSSGDQLIMDMQDHSVTRSLKHYNELFRRAVATGCVRVESCTRQEGFPPAVFPVYTWVLKKQESAIE
jgi:protein N-terminal methyltransferase